jgi:ATP-dependent protease ClpP protease subunit
MESMYTDKDEIINVNESINEIHFNASVTPKTMSILIDKLLELQEKILRKEKQVKRKFREFEKDDEFEQINFIIKPTPIKLYITTNGGYVYQVFSAIDTIRNMKIPVHTICKGFVASAGTLLSLAGDKRYITENSFMLIHELRSGTWGKFTHMVESIENSRQLMEHIKSYYIKYTKMTAEELDEHLKKDITWNAEICLEKGLVHKIIKFDKNKKKKDNDSSDEEK